MHQVHRQGRHGHHGDADKQHQHREDERAVGAGHRPLGVPGFLGEVRDGLDARVGDHGHGGPTHEVERRGGSPPVDLVQKERMQGIGQHHQEEAADRHQHDLRRQVEHGEDDAQRRRLFHAD